MSVCSNEVCALSEKKSAIKTMASLMEDPNRASPVPFSKSDVVNEAYKARALETARQSERVETSETENVQITRKTKVEESFVRSQKVYTAEINTSSQGSVQLRAASPEMEQIMAKREIYQAYQGSSQAHPQVLALQQNKSQSERCLTPEIENLMDKPHGTWSPMPPACLVRPISPHLIISYPPDVPQIPANLPPSRTATPEQFQEARETVERFVDHTKQVHHHSMSTSRNMQSYTQQPIPTKQYMPKYDNSQGFSAYVSNNGNRGTHGNGNPENHGNVNPENHGNGNHGNENPENHRNGNHRNHGNGNPGNHRNGNPGNHGNGNSGNHGNGHSGNHENGNSGNNGNDKAGEKEKPKVTEPDSSEDKYSRKSSRSEEESSQRVFSDFGGPHVYSTVDVESTTEGGVQKTSVKKSEKTEYSSCEFESSRKSSVVQNDESKEQGSSGEPRKHSFPKFTAEATIDEEEKVTKSQVEEIIKQELNKVFNMAQSMEKSDYGEIYEQKLRQASSEQMSHYDTKVEQSVSQTIDQKSICSKNRDKIPFTGEVLTTTGKLTSGLTIAPDRPFTPQGLESNYPLPYQNMPSDFPPPRGFPEHRQSKPAYVPVTRDGTSPFIQALTIAPDRPYSPLPTATAVDTPSHVSPPKPKSSSMMEALTTAPTTPFHIKGVESEVIVEKSETVKKTSDKSGTVKTISEVRQEIHHKYSPKPVQSDFKPISSTKTDQKPPSYATLGQTADIAIKSFPPVTDELKSAFKSTSKVQTSAFAESERKQLETSKQTQIRTERSTTPSGLHPPNLLPYYQQHIGEIPLAHRSNSPVPHQIKAPSITPQRAESVPRSTVKALSEAYTQQLSMGNQQQASGTSSVSYVSAGAYSQGAITKTYSYEQEHKSIDALGYHASPLAGKLPLAGEQTLPKCSSPLLGKLDHTKQVFKPPIPPQQTTTVFRSPVAEQANLRQAPPYFVQDKETSRTVSKEKDYAETVNVSLKTSQTAPSSHSFSQPSFKPVIPTVDKTRSAFPEPPKPFSLPGLSKLPSAIPDAGPGGAPKSGSTAGTTAPRRGRGVLNAAAAAGTRVPLCGMCNSHIRGPFITALGKIWCPEHFVCVNAQCRRQLQDIGFVEDEQGLYCEYCFEKYLAPTCNKCNAKVKGDCLNAIGKHFHPECFTCAYCGKHFGNNPFFLEDALPYCENDWNELFTTKCFSCGFPIEAGDRWVEALNNNYHSQCFNCTMCKKNLEGQSFFAKGGRPFCKNHAR